MGLDMYLKKYPKYSNDLKENRAISEFVNWIKDGCWFPFEAYCDRSFDINDLPDTKTLIKILEKSPYDNRDKEVCYWRKANQIHRWFVENIQDGEDDCCRHRAVTKEDLESLLNACKAVLKNHALAEEVLPVMPGFFFGKYDYDDYYFDHIEMTVEKLEEILETFDFENYELYYESSW